MSQYEYCTKCGVETGRAGISEDSLYIGTEGPFCESCFEQAELLIAEDAATREHLNSLIDKTITATKEQP